MKMYAARGVTDFIVCLGYKGYMVKEFFSSYALHLSDVTFDLGARSVTTHRHEAEDWRVTLVDTGDATMTGGRLARVLKYVTGDIFCFTYGDGVSDVNIAATIEFHRKHGRKATVTAVYPPRRFGVLDLDGERVTGFREKPRGEGGFERGFNQIFKPVGTTPFRASRRYSWFIAEARRLGAHRILELGCGTGEASASVAAGVGAEVVAVDISDDFLARARAAHVLPNLRFEKLDLLGDDVGRLGQFDLVFGNGILHHLVLRLNDVLRALHSLSNKGGGLAFIEPNFLNPYCAFIFGTGVGRRFAKLEPDEMAFTPGQLRRALPETGWRDVSVRTRDFLLPGLPTPLTRPILAVEPALEATPLTRWLAQSHFISARA
jgi:SAM-dependent methyltransferase